MKNLLVVLFTIMSCSLFAQGFRSIGVEASGLVVEKISSSGVTGTYSLGLNLEYEVSDVLSFVVGAKYNKYGTHVHYTKFASRQTESPLDGMTEKSVYKINSFAVPVTAKLNTKFFSIQIGVQGDRFAFQSPEVSYILVAEQDVNFENYAQEDLRKFNLSAIAGIQFKRNFSDNIEMFVRPSAQYLFKPFFKNGGFEDVKMTYSFSVGANCLLAVNHK